MEGLQTAGRVHGAGWRGGDFQAVMGEFSVFGGNYGLVGLGGGIWMDASLWNRMENICPPQTISFVDKTISPVLGCQHYTKAADITTFEVLIH